MCKHLKMRSPRTKILQPGPLSVSSADDYFLQVLRPNARVFFASPSTFATAFNLATSLFHFHEWLFHEHRSLLESTFGVTFKTPGAFWKHVQSSDLNYGYIRDLANASKHMVIGTPGHAPPSTTMTHAANTHITSSSFGQGAFGARRFGGGPNVVFSAGGSDVDFDPIATKLLSYWTQLLQSLTGKLYP